MQHSSDFLDNCLDDRIILPIHITTTPQQFKRRIKTCFLTFGQFSHCLEYIMKFKDRK